MPVLSIFFTIYVFRISDKLSLLNVCLDPVFLETQCDCVYAFYLSNLSFLQKQTLNHITIMKVHFSLTSS